MAKGRKRTPTRLKLITGTARADRINKNEPRPEPALPSPPQHLRTSARTEWHRVARVLYAQGILSDLDRGALAAYCESYGIWVDASRLLKKAADEDETGNGGLMIKTAMGNLIYNPLHGIATKARSDLLKFAAEFGMTPAARARVSADPDAGPRDPGESYFS